MEELREIMTVSTRYILSIPELFPMVGLRRDQGRFPAVMNEDRGIDRGQNRMEMPSSQDMKSIHKDTIQRGELNI